MDADSDEPSPNLLLEELARLREEVVNTRNLTIKSENALKNLSAEIKAITKKQEGQDRKALLNSIGAYILFVALIATGLYLTFQARFEKTKADQALFDKKEAGYQQEITELQAELGRWKQVERELLEFERLVKDGNKEQAVAAFTNLRRLRFAGLLEDLIIRFKSEVAKEQFDKGVQLYDQGNFSKADEAFLKSIEYDEKPAYQGVMAYYQGMSALRLKDFPRASELLRKALGFDLESRVQADASFNLAYAHDRMGEKRTARDLYFRFFNRYPKNMNSPRARQRFDELKGD